VDTQTEPWLSSDRDYTYQEVSSNYGSFHSVVLTSSAASPQILRTTPRLEPCPFLFQYKTLHYRSPTNYARRQQEINLCQYSRHL
jgi:hypothetical protein